MNNNKRDDKNLCPDITAPTDVTSSLNKENHSLSK